MAAVEMKYRSLGSCGMKISVLSLGGWTTFGESVRDEKLVRDIFHVAFDAGINHFDLADIYAIGECERIVGKAIKDLPRHRMVLASKTFWPMSDDVNDRGCSRKHIMESIDKSLKRIGSDYVDIYYCHRYDNDTPLEETVRAMDDLIHQGKALYWGTSEWSGDQMRAAHKICKENNLYCPQVEQPEYNLMYYERVEKDVAPATNALGMGLVVWSPLGSGVLTGKYDDGIPEDSRLSRMKAEDLPGDPYTDENVEKVIKMKKIADKIGCTRAQLALAWAVSQSGITSVITGATKIEQLRENLGSLNIDITKEIIDLLDTLFR